MMNPDGLLSAYANCRPGGIKKASLRERKGQRNEDESDPLDAAGLKEDRQ